MTEPDPNTSSTANVSEGYDVLSERANHGLAREASPWGDSYFQAHYSWPATRAILPAVADQRVLIAGSGRGDHVEWFLDRGATVVGIDASERAVSTARSRFGEEATFHHADLTEPLDFPDDAFDLVFSHLVLGHVREWRPVFDEFHRVLTDRGTLAFATIHPAYLRRKHGVTNYYEIEKIVVSWPDAEIPTYYRPMEAVLEPLAGTGFRLEAFEEPKPQETFAKHAPERYEKAMQSPEALCIRAQADPVP